MRYAHLAGGAHVGHIVENAWCLLRQQLQRRRATGLPRGSEIASLIGVLLESMAFKAHGPLPAGVAAYPRLARDVSLDHAMHELGLAPLEEAAVGTPAARAHVPTNCETSETR